MANIMENRVNTKLDPQRLLDALDTINSIGKILPESEGSLTLSNDERLSYNSIDVDNKAFAEDVIFVLMQPERAFIPEYIDVAMIRNDVELFEQMDQLHYALSAALTRVSDVKRIAASEAMNVANAVYGLSEMGAAIGLPGAKAAYDKLKVRYKGNGGGAKEKTLE